MKDIFQMSNKAYDRLKWLCLIFLPAVSVAYSGLSGTWGLPYATEIPATLSVLQIFLGSLLGVSTIAYQRGNLTEGGGADG